MILFPNRIWGLAVVTLQHILKRKGGWGGVSKDISELLLENGFAPSITQSYRQVSLLSRSLGTKSHTLQKSANYIRPSATPNLFSAVCSQSGRRRKQPSRVPPRQLPCCLPTHIPTRELDFILFFAFLSYESSYVALKKKVPHQHKAILALKRKRSGMLGRQQKTAHMLVCFFHPSPL